VGLVQGTEVGEEGDMKFAIADPPYVGQAKLHYGSEEVDHAALIQQLVDEYPDGQRSPNTSATRS